MAASDTIKIRHALISSHRKPEAVELARTLSKLGVSITASGGTADALAGAGIPVRRLEEVTGFERLLDGRVKTLHPAVHAAILARRDRKEDVEQVNSLGLEPFDLVAVDLYPFVEKAGTSSDAEAVELVDIGGVAMIRAAAKNHEFVTILSRAEQFAPAGDLIARSEGAFNPEQRRKFAQEAFEWTSCYDSVVAARFSEGSGDAATAIHLFLKLKQGLRYGENPGQEAGFYVPTTGAPVGIAAARQLHGKELSYNNLLDLDIALRLPREFSEPAVAILKHTTPCGVGRGEHLLEAFTNALSTDPQSAFGGIVGLNRVVDKVTAQAIREGFVELVVAPGFDADALTELKKSKNLRILEFHSESVPDVCEQRSVWVWNLKKVTAQHVAEYWLTSNVRELRSVWGGFLMQGADLGFPELAELKVVSSKQPTSEQREALGFAWRVARYVKSNAIVFTDRNRTLGMGAGQMSRVDAAHLAVWKAAQSKLSLECSVAASDAFFPFRDGLDVIADAGATAVIQPGGSVRDEEVIEAANERGIVMVFTGQRHFRH